MVRARGLGGETMATRRPIVFNYQLKLRVNTYSANAQLVYIKGCGWRTHQLKDQAMRNPLIPASEFPSMPTPALQAIVNDRWQPLGNRMLARDALAARG